MSFKKSWSLFRMMDILLRSSMISSTSSRVTTVNTQITISLSYIINHTLDPSEQQQGPTQQKEMDKPKP